MEKQEVKGTVDSYGIEQHDHEFRRHLDQKLEHEIAVEHLAEQRFMQFVKELTTAMDNTHKNLEYGAFMEGLNGSPSNYYEAKGRAKAWGEIYERFNKEVGLALHHREYSIDLDEEAHMTLRKWRDKRVDTILPENRARGNQQLYMQRRHFAESIEDALAIGYRLGKQNKELSKYDIL